METKKAGAVMLAGLLYAQSLLGLVAVAAVVSKNAGSAAAPDEGYGIARPQMTLAMTGVAEPSGPVWRE